MTGKRHNTAATAPAKVGRPRLSDVGDLLATVNAVYADGACDRTQQNRAYCARAISILGVKQRWKWLGLTAEQMKSSRKMKRRSVLTELGRIRDPKFLTACAAELCKSKPPSTRLAIRYVRNWRNGIICPSDTMDLAGKINRVVHDARKDHRLSWDEIRRVVMIVCDQLPTDPHDDEEEGD